MVGGNRRGRSCEVCRVNFGTELKLMNNYSLKRKGVHRCVSLLLIVIWYVYNGVDYSPAGEPHAACARHVCGTCKMPVKNTVNESAESPFR